MSVVFVLIIITITLAFAGFLLIPTPVAAICRRELYTLVNGPIGLVSLIAFLIISQTMYVVVIFTYDEASMRPFFEKIPLAFSLVAPLVAMRMWAEERRTQTIELLLTLPNKTWSAVLGKFLAGWAFLAICMFCTISTPIFLETVMTESDIETTTEMTASDNEKAEVASESNTGTVIRSGPDWGPIWGGYTASLLLAAFTLSIGSFTSSITRDQIVAAILGVTICIIFWILSHQLVVYTLNDIGSGAGTFLSAFSHQQRFLNLAKGLWDWTDVLFFVSGTGVFLWMTSVVVEKQRD